MSGSEPPHAASLAIRPVALTMGEPAGIGAEIALKAWYGRGASLPPFFVIDDPDRLAALAQSIGLAVPVVPIDRPSQALAAFERGLPVVPLALARPAVPGRPDPANGPAVLDSIVRAVAFVRAGEASAIVTGSIQKKTLYEAGFAHPGHTEYLAELGRRRRAAGDDAGGRRPARRAGDDPHAAARGAGQPHHASIVATGRIVARGAGAGFRHRSAAARRRRRQPACRRRRRARTRGYRDRGAGRRRPARRRHRRDAARCRPTRCSTTPRAPATTRRCACTTIRR